MKRLDSIEGKLGPLEDRLGRNPEARIRLGMAGTKLKTKLDEFWRSEFGSPVELELLPYRLRDPVNAWPGVAWRVCSDRCEGSRH